VPCRLTRQAEEDVIRIYRDGARLFVPRQAETYHRELAAVFDLLGRHPRIARERHELRPPVRAHPHKAHLILYLIEDDGGVLIVRLRHGHEDWEREPI
jgi:toxin ParE1/3/4